MAGNNNAEILKAIGDLKTELQVDNKKIREEMDTSIKAAVAAAMKPFDDRLTRCEELFKQFETRIKSLEQSTAPHADGPPNKRRAQSVSSGRPRHPRAAMDTEEYKVKIKGFPVNTFHDEIESCTKKILSDIGHANYTKVYAPGRRADKGYAIFEDLDYFKEVLKATKGEIYKGQVLNDRGEQVECELRMVPHLSPTEWEETKETRILTRVIADIAKVTQSSTSWKKVSADHYRQKAVYMGRVVVGEFRQKNDMSEEKEFVIHEDHITEQAKRLNLEITGEQAKAAYDAAIAM